MKITEAILKDMILEQLLLENPTSIDRDIRGLNRAENYSILRKYYRQILSKRKYMDPKYNFLREDFDAIAYHFELGYNNMTDEEISNDINDRRKDAISMGLYKIPGGEKIGYFYKLEKSLGFKPTSLEYNKKLLIAAIMYADILEGFAEASARRYVDTDRDWETL